MEYNPSLTPAYLAGKVDEYVKFAARDTIKRNAKRDRNARYARVPDGEACDFCVMLGSRGFVYHSEETAGSIMHGTEDDAYHPFCNCQIAVCFDPFFEEYYKGWTKVRRGYGDGEVVVTGRDGSDVLREVDIDELFDEYKAMVRDFNKGGRGSRYKDYMLGAMLTDEQYAAAVKRLTDAQTADELREAADDIVAKWPANANGRHKRQWDELSKLAKARQKELTKGSTEYREAMKDSLWYKDAQTRRVHWDVVNDKAYAARLNTVVNDKVMARLMHDDVKSILRKADRTPFEELYAYDLTAGERIDRVIDQRVPLGVEPTEKFNARVSERIEAGHRVVMLHNHSGSSIPSLADIHALKARGGEFGIVACHDGTIYTYRIVGEPAEGYIIDGSKEAGREYMKSYADRLISKGPDLALESLGDLYGVKFERVL